MKSITSIFVALVCSVSMAHSQTLLSVNFLDDQAGQAPSSGTITGAEQGRIIVVDSGTSPASPFAGGAQGLLIEKVSQGAVPTIRWDVPKTLEGQLEASVYAMNASGSFSSSGAIYLYQGNALGAGVIWSNVGRLSIMARVTEDGANEVINFNSSIPFDASTNVKLLFREGVVSVLINDVLQESTIGQTEFFMRLSEGSIDNIRFGDPSTTSQNRRFYVESFEVRAIPEPSTVGLLGVFGVSGMLLHRKLRVCSPQTPIGK